MRTARPIVAAALAALLPTAALAWPPEQRVTDPSPPPATDAAIGASPTDLDALLGADTAPARLANGEEIRVAPGQVRFAQAPLGATVISLDPDIVAVRREPNGLYVVEGLTLGTGLVLVKRDGEVATVRVVVANLAPASNHSGPPVFQSGGIGFLSQAEGDRSWGIDLSRAWGMSGTINTVFGASWNDLIRETSQEGVVSLISSPERVTLNRFSSLTEHGRVRLALGDQQVVGLPFPVFGLGPSVRIAESVRITSILGARRVPGFDLIPGQDTPSIAAAGFDGQRSGFHGSVLGGAT